MCDRLGWTVDLNRICYVNPSWNLGVSVAKEPYVGILNDDIIIAEGLFSGLSNVPIENLGVIELRRGRIIISNIPFLLRKQNNR